jgi:hypothetical protein
MPITKSRRNILSCHEFCEEFFRGTWAIGELEFLGDWGALLSSVTPELLQLLTPVLILSQVEKIGAGLLTTKTAFY